MIISCEDYYENYLGDWCNNKCDKCFADKELYVVQETFEVCGDTLLDKVAIEKGSWFWIKSKNNTHVILDNGGDRLLYLVHDLFEKYFGLNEPKKEEGGIE